VHRVYNGVQVGEKGEGSVIGMAVVLGVKKIWDLVSKGRE
jgi:hypothetical protein